MSVSADSVVVELEARNAQYDRAIAGSAQGFEASMSRVERSAARVEGSTTRALANIAQESERTSIAQIVLQSAVRKSADQFAAGAPLATILAEHLGTVAEAAQLSGSSLGGMGAILSGPWGIAVTAGVSILSVLIPKLLESAGATDDNEKSLKEAAIGLREFQQRQADIGNYIDATTGKLKEQNATLLRNAFLSRDAAITANNKKITGSRDQAFLAASRAGIRDVNAAPSTTTSGVSFGNDPEVQAAIKAAGQNVQELDRQFASLSQRRPELRGIALEVSNLASQAVLAQRDSGRLKTEIDELSGKTTVLAKGTARATELQVALATATTPLERARARYNLVVERGAAAEKEGGAALTQFQADLTSASEAVHAAEAAKTAATAGHKALGKAARDAAAAHRELSADLTAIIGAFDPAAAAAAKYAVRLKEIAALRKAGLITPDKAATYTAAAAEERDLAVRNADPTNLKQLDVKLPSLNTDQFFREVDSGLADRYKTQEAQEKHLDDLREEQVRSLAQTFTEAFEGGSGSIWQTFKRQGLETLALLLAKFAVLEAGSIKSGQGGSSLLANLTTAAKAAFSTTSGTTPARASGGPVEGGRLYRINEGATPGRVEGFVPQGSGKIIPLGDMRAANRGGGQTTILQTFQLDLRGGVTTPELLEQVNDIAQSRATQAVALGGRAIVQSTPGYLSQQQKLKG